MGNSASYEQWIDTYQAAYASVTGTVGIACPNCAARDLRLVFITRGNRDRGQANMWCMSCRNGIFLAPCLIPENADSVAEGEVDIPNFSLVVPGEPPGKSDT